MFWHGTIILTLFPARREQEKYFQDHSDNLIQKLRDQCKDDPLDMSTYYNLVAFDIVSDLAFGEPSGYVNNPDQPWIQAILARAKAIVWFQLAVQYGCMDLCYGYEEKQITCWCSGATSSLILYLLPQLYYRYVM
jgi:hypothetical protein